MNGISHTFADLPDFPRGVIVITEMSMPRPSPLTP
jgi:hypothetical protein